MNVPSAVMELFVTHIETESRLLKIWAQLERTQAIFVERLIVQITQLHFNKGDGVVDPRSLEVGQLCCAKYIDSDDQCAYYRARVVNLDKAAEGKVVVQFVDYGNQELMQISDIRSLHSMQTPLTNVRPQATAFYLAGVISKTPTWDDASLETIRRHLRYEEVQGVLMAEVAEKKLLRIYFDKTDYSELLTSKGIGIPIQLTSQQQFLLQSASLQMHHPFHGYNFNMPPPRLIAPPERPMTMMHSNIQPRVPDPRIHRPHNVASQGEKVFTTPILDINTEHMVYVSFVEDGPWSFAVQLQAMEETLAQLMVEINEYPPAPLSHPLMPGSVCLGRFSEDQTLCRAVVMSVMTDKCMLYYVDFGNSETRPYSEIYELPPQYINPKVMALRFTLSGLKDVPESDEIKALFKEIVTEKLLVLKVVTPDGPPVKQYCELTHNGQNVLQILIEKTKPLEYKPLPLSIGAKDMALVSYIVNPSHFYIQLSRHVSALNSVMMAVEAHCTNSAPPLSQQSLKVGLACCALYAEDEKWYRAQIISILSEAVNVKYVDYGNSDTVSLSSLRKIERNLVSVLHMQAVKCCLNGFEDMKSDSLATKFEELTGDETLKFVILGKVEDCFIVDLYNISSGTEIDIGSVLLETKAAMEQPIPQPVQHESRFEAPASAPTPVTEEPDEWQEGAHFQETSEETSGFNKNYQSRAAEKERFNRGASRNDEDNKDSWRAQKEDRSWRNRDDGNANWRDDHDKGRRGKERFGEGKWGGRDETEREQKPWREDSGEQREYKKKPWGRDEDRGGFGGGGHRRNTEDGEGLYGRRNEDRRRNADDGDGGFQSRRGDGRRNADDGDGGFQSRRGDDRRRNAENGDGGFYGRRDDDRRKRFNNDDSRRGRDTDRKWKNTDDGGFDSSRGGRKPWNNRDNNYNQFDQKTSQFGESASNDQGEEEWGDDSTAATTTTKASVTIKPPSINIGDIKTVEVVFSTNPQDFYVQVSDSSELFTLMDVIATTYESAGPVNAESLKTGSACIARYAEDETWYRAVVESVSADSAMVFFCDYGNKENVQLTDIKEIKSEHIHLPAQGISCSLLAAKPQDHSWLASEIDSFTGATEGKTLEANFISQNNGRFDVILKDTESNSDINLQFGATRELLEAKPAVRKPVYDTFSAPAQSQPLIELNQRYSCQTFSPDTVEQVSITWFIDPEQFYCQLKSSQAAMNDMMASIQEAYCSKSPTSRPFQVGLPIIAKFRGDNVLYRAEVKDIEDPVSVVVQFIDFGNCDNVMNSCVWDMEARFMDLPKQAVFCTLQGVKPVDEKWSQKDTMKFFEVEEFQCTFHRYIEEKFEVSLVHSGVNVASNLIEAGLAREEIVEAAGETISDEEPVELTLLPGQILNVHVTFVESASKFFVHLNAAFAQKIQAMVDQHAENPENLQPVDAEKLSVGDLCLASPDSVQWYRAKIGDCAQTTGVFVTFIDFGDGDEVPVNKVMVSPSPLQNQPAQATECGLHGLNITLSPEAEDKFKSDIEDKDVIMKVEAVETERLLVSLYDMEGKKLEILKDTTAKPLIECLCPLPVLSRRIRVWVSHVNNANSIWLQRVSDSEVLSELLDKIHNTYEEEGKGAEITAAIGNLCAAKSESFGTWYRARIISVNSEEDSCNVLFIDYGNTESLPIATNIKSLDTALFSPHELAVQISLPLTTPEDLASQLQEMTADKEFTAVFCERNNDIWLADLLEGNNSLSGKLIELGHATLLPGMKIENEVTELNKESASELAGSLEVYVSHFDLPGQFWLQLANNMDAIMKFQENIQIITESLPAVDAAQVGLRCIAQFSDDGLWYRAEVLDINSSYITVRYTDYGNTSQVEVTAEGIKELPEELGSIPDFAFPCRINASPVDGSYWNAEAVARCEELLNQEAVITINIVGEEEMKIVDVFVDGVSVVDVLLKENLAVPRKSPVAECPLKAVPEADISSNVEHTDLKQVEDTVEPSSCADNAQGLEIAAENGVCDELEEQPESYTEDNLAVVSHAESLEEFWLQYHNKSDQVHQLVYRLLEGESFPILNDITEGKLCTAIFDEDCQWYRAKILGKVDQGIQVEFIDYGNKSICEDLRKLPADLANLPPMAKRCCLALPETVTEWPPGANEKFLDLVSDGCKLFDVEIIEQGDPVTVNLAYDGHLICKDLLEASISTADPIESEQPVEQENSVYYIIDKEEYQEDITKVPEFFEDKVGVPKGETVITDDVQETEKLDIDVSDKCEDIAHDKVDVTTVMYMISDDQESQKEDAYDDEQESDLNEKSISHDRKEEPKTEASSVKDNAESLLAEETLMGEIYEENEGHDISAAESKQYIDANDGTAPTEGSEVDSSLAHCNLVDDEKAKTTKELSEQEVCALNTTENPNGAASAEKTAVVEFVSDLNETLDKDSQEHDTETSSLNGVKDDSVAPVAEETSRDENDTEIENSDIIAAEGKQYLGANDSIVPTEGSELVKQLAGNEANVLNSPENTKKDPHSEKPESDCNGIIGNLKSSECKTQHTEELVRKINVEMMVMDKTEKVSQIDRIISVSGSKELSSASSALPHSDETGPNSLPEELPRSQTENGATKSEPCTPLLSRAGRLIVKDESETQERSLSSPRLSHNERIVPGCISRGESLDSVDETLSVTVIQHDTEKIVPDTIKDEVNC